MLSGFVRLYRTYPAGHGRGALRPNLNSLSLFAIVAQLTMPSGGLASELGEAPVRMDQEQVSGEIEILAGEFTGREFQLDRVVSRFRASRPFARQAWPRFHLRVASYRRRRAPRSIPFRWRGLRLFGA
jgi:hypothetical protein